MSAGQTRAIVDKLLSDVSIALIPEGYVSEDVLPNKTVVQTTGLIGQYGKNWLRIVNSVMGGKGKAPRVDSVVRSTTTYTIEGHGLETEVSPDDYRNVYDPFDAEQDEVIGLTNMLWLGKEKALADAMTSTGTMTQNTTLSGTAQFSDYNNSNPLKVFSDAFATIKANAGVFPNSCVMDSLVYNKLRYHPALADILGFKFNREGQLSHDDIKTALGVKNLYIGDAVYNSAKDGQTDSLATVWNKSMVFYYKPDSVSKYQVSLGYYLTYQNEGPRKVYKFPVYNPPESTGIIVKDSYDMLLSNVSAGYLIAGAVA